MKFDDFTALLNYVFEDNLEAARWMEEKNPRLDNLTPTEALAKGFGERVVYILYTDVFGNLP